MAGPVGVPMGGRVWRSCLVSLLALCLSTWPAQGFVPAPYTSTPTRSTPPTTTRLGSAILPLDGSEAPRTATEKQSTVANIIITDLMPSDLRIAAGLCIEAFFGSADRNPIRNLQLQSLLDEQITDLKSRYRRTTTNRMLKALDPQGNMVGFVEVGLSQAHKYGMPRDVPEREFRPCLSNLAVRRANRRTGIGSRLAKACEDTVLQWGFDEMILQVEEDNIAARELYKGEGYRELYIDRGARKYDIAGMSIKSVPVSKITMRKLLVKPNPVQQLLSSFFPQPQR